MEAYGIDPTQGVGAVQSGRHGTLPGGGWILRADHLRLAMNHIMERDTDSIDIGMMYYPRLLSAMNILYSWTIDLIVIYGTLLGQSSDRNSNAALSRYCSQFCSCS